MSKRFGRSQRRDARQRIETLGSDNLRLFREVQATRDECERALRETRDVVKAVEEIAPMSAAIEPRLEQLRDHASSLRVRFFGAPALGAIRDLAEPISAREVILNRLRVDVVADHMRQGLVCRAEIHETGSLEVFLTAEALRASRAREWIARDVAAKLVAGFAKGLQKLAIGPRAGS